jgi:hypothetical protein
MLGTIPAVEGSPSAAQADSAKVAEESVNSAAEPENVVVKGKAMQLSSALKEMHANVKPDADPIAQQIVVLQDDHSLVPLLPDEASRALFRDDRLQDRVVEIQGRKYRGLPYVQVITFKVEQDGRLQTPEYYCNICTISVRSPQICPCCQGEMELRMKPERR